MAFDELVEAIWSCLVIHRECALTESSPKNPFQKTPKFVKGENSVKILEIVGNFGGRILFFGGDVVF